MGSEEEDLEPRGFQAGVDLRSLGAMAQSIWEWERERERKKEREQHITAKLQGKEKERKSHIHEKCMNMWRAKFKDIMGKNLIQTYQHIINNKQTHI